MTLPALTQAEIDEIGERHKRNFVMLHDFKLRDMLFAQTFENEEGKPLGLILKCMRYEDGEPVNRSTGKNRYHAVVLMDDEEEKLYEHLAKRHAQRLANRAAGK